MIFFSSVSDSDNTLRAIWNADDYLSIDMESEVTCFTLIVKPEIDGSTSDIFETQLDPWSELIIEDEITLIAYEVGFEINVAPRNLLGIDDVVESSNVRVYPNLSLQNISLEGIRNPHFSTTIETYNPDRKLMSVEKFTSLSSNLTIDISGLPSGMFILKTQNRSKLISHKFFKI